MKLQWIKKLTTKAIGDSTEALAANYLKTQGLALATQNYSSKYGEIDLICQDGQTWVFVEVKYRRSAAYGGAISTISSTKQQKLKLCASFYLQQLGINEYNTSCRFDVVALQGDLTQPQITWLKNAF
ncbi:MAG: YraN family protein [Colwelliaceae bacterium]|nr:YraN family protein [Colwelliaceae bacterium]